MNRFLAVLIALTFPALVHAAEIDRYRVQDLGIDMISVKGPIVHGDAERFLRATSDTNKAIVVLNSEGGIVVEALTIGREIRRKDYATSVFPTHLCASACALIWLAGGRRYAEENSPIGFHASYIIKDGVPLESGAVNALVGSYVSQLGLSDEVVLYVTSAPPKGMRWLTRQDALRMDLPYITNQAAMSQGAVPQMMKGEAYDPVGTTKRFYQALGVADGNAAATLVIPEKRGAGPFNEIEINRFFGGMREPLLVEQIQQVAENLVSVRYRYQKDATKACAGQAKVTTTYKYGRTLIEKIAANC